MRFIYLDEAGTSASEPVSVVAAVIVHGDKQWRQLERKLEELLESEIPKEYREGFIFHAKDIFAAKIEPFKSDRQTWPIDRRIDLICQLLRIRSSAGFSASVGYWFKEDGKYQNEKGYAKVRHLGAYMSCIAGCEAYLREFGDPDEVAIVVAEDVPKMKKAIEDIHEDFTRPQSSAPVYRELMPIRHIKDTVHFATKRKAVLLQYADALAFAYRRIRGGYDHSEPFLRAIFDMSVIQEIDGAKAGYQILVSQPIDVEGGIDNAIKSQESGWTP